MWSVPELVPAPEESAEVPALQLRMQRISFCILQTGAGLSKVDIRRYRISERRDLPGLLELSKSSEASEQPVLILSLVHQGFSEQPVSLFVPAFLPVPPVFPVVPAAPGFLKQSGLHPDPVVYCEHQMELRDFLQWFPVF